MTSTAGAPAIALVGCGAIAELFHLPALAQHPEILRQLVLVDPSRARAEALARLAPGARIATSLDEVLGDVRGAVLAVPHRLHVPLTLACAAKGVHVLCEKPLAESVAEVDAILAATAGTGATVSVNNMRRFYPAVRDIHRLVRAGELGRLRRITMSWGEQFEWPAASGFYFGLASHGRGALLDKGAHLVDLACWWLGGAVSLTQYRDDAMGGAECWAELIGERDGCRVELRLNWLSRYDNVIEIEGERGGVRLGLFDWISYQRLAPGRRPRTVTLPAPVAAPREIGRLVVAAFLDCVRGVAPPVVGAADVRDSIALIEQAYGRRERVTMPWFDAWERYRDAVHA